MNEQEDQSKQQSNEAAAVNTLKEVNAEAEKKTVDEGKSITADDQSTPEEAAEQIRGSDADADQSQFNNDQPSTEETKEELKGSDADIDRPDQ